MVQELSLDIVKNLLSFDEERGTLRWMISGHGKNVGQEAGGIHKTDGYKVLTIFSRQYKYHRIVWLLHYGKWPDGVIDHINGDKLDNRISNLRDVSNKINLQNHRKPSIKNKSGFLGVIKASKNRWSASLKINGKSQVVGYFKTPEEAHQAYVVAKRQHHPGCTL